MKILIIALLVCVILAGSARATDFLNFGVRASENNASTVEAVTANLASTSTTIPANFVGFSEENADVVDGGAPYTGRLFASTNTSLLNLIKLLGTSGLVRIGANSSESPFGNQLTTPPLTQPIANEIEAFAANLGSGWTVVYELDGKSNNTSLALTQAGYLISAFTGAANPLILGFFNEPEFAPISESQTQTTFNAYYASITGAYSGVLFNGLENGGPHGGLSGAQMAAWINGLTPGISGLAFASFHNYPEGQFGSSIAATISDAAAVDFSQYATQFPGKWRVDEANVCYGTVNSQVYTHGLTASAWFINTAINIAKQGGIGISPHNVLSVAAQNASPGFTWNSNAWLLQSDGGWAPGGIFYGMFLMSKIEGQQIVATTTSGAGTVNAISTKGPNGNANILVVNDDVSNPISIKPDQSNSWATARVLTVQPSISNGCSNLTPIAGGAAIGESGAWAGGFTSIANGQSVALQPCASALIEIQP